AALNLLKVADELGRCEIAVLQPATHDEELPPVNFTGLERIPTGRSGAGRRGREFLNQLLALPVVIGQQVGPMGRGGRAADFGSDEWVAVPVAPDPRGEGEKRPSAAHLGEACSQFGVEGSVELRDRLEDGVFEEKKRILDLVERTNLALPNFLC